MVSFTGSTSTGRAVMADGAATLKKVFLELGGKSAFLVLDDADLAGACSMSAFTASMHAGQGCAITTRLVVPRARYDEAVEAAAATMAGAQAGRPDGSRHHLRAGDLGARSATASRATCDSAIDEGGTFACGGGRPADRDTRLLHRADRDRRPRQQRQGRPRGDLRPGADVIAHDGDDDAVRIANDSPYGLSGTVFSRGRRARRGGARRGCASAP